MGLWEAELQDCVSVWDVYNVRYYHTLSIRNISESTALHLWHPLPIFYVQLEASVRVNRIAI